VVANQVYNVKKAI